MISHIWLVFRSKLLNRKNGEYDFTILFYINKPHSKYEKEIFIPIFRGVFIMKKFKLSKRTKATGIATLVFGGATAVSIMKDQINEIGKLNNEIRCLDDKICDNLLYELNLESFIAKFHGEDILAILNIRE